jgi:sigma-54 dependent transcriptional regulator, acetoin dehydrogenase operon transcriptional activator AcoR
MNGGDGVTSGQPLATSGTAPTGAARRGGRRQAEHSIKASAWERFLAGEDVSEGVSPEILLSWYRCRDDYKVDPFRERAPSAPDDGPPHALEDDVVVAELGGIAKSIEPDVEAIDGLVAITDGRGRILAAWGDRHAIQLADDRNLAPWCAWSEEGAGTNGMGTALTSEKAIFIKGPEHWCAGFHEWECAGVAIRDPVTNDPLAVLDVSSSKKPLPDAVLTWLSRAQQKTEAGLRDRAVRSFCDLVTVYRAQERGAKGPLAAADNGGRLLLANEDAQRFFGIARPDPPRVLTPDLPQLKEALLKAAERARRDRMWTGVAQLFVPAVGCTLPVAFRPAVRNERVVGVLLSAPGTSAEAEAEPEGETLTTEEAAVPVRSQGRLVGLQGDRMILLSSEEVRYAEADGNDVWLDTDRGRLRAPGRGIGRLEERLRGQGFLRVHRHFLVNLRRVKEIAPSFQGCFWLILDVPGHQLIPVSRRRTAEVRKSLGLSLSWSQWKTPAPPSGL